MFADELEKADYDGPVLYEVEPGTTGRIERPVELTAADFKENYDCIMQRKELPLHGGRRMFK